MAEYKDFLPSQRLGKSLSISGDGSMVAYTGDASGQFNLMIQPVDGGPTRQLTSFTEQAVREVAWSPDRTMIAFTADTCGDEDYQVYLIPADGGTPARVTGGTGQHALAEKSPFDPQQRFLLYSGPNSEPAIPDVITYRLSGGAEGRFHGQEYTASFAIAVSPDGQQLLAGAIASNTKCQCFLAPVDRPGAVLDAVTAHLPGEYYYPGPWAGGSNSFYVLTTDADQDHVALAHYSLDDRTLTVVDSPSWDVEDVVVSGDGRTVIWSVNEDGCSVLRARRDGLSLRIPPVPAGVIQTMSISNDGATLALVLETSTRPRSVAVLQLGAEDPIRHLTETGPTALKAGEAVVPELVRFPSEDGTLVPALLYRPPGPGPHPVLISVHGGPEQQARPDYDELHQCLLANGIAVLAPNIRGSSGYGHTWQTRIYRDWGGIDLDDLAAAHVWLTAQHWARPDKIAIYGMSYGGFASLSCMTRLPDLWAAGVSVCGPSNLDSLARSMPPSWAATVAAMFGNPDNPADAEKIRLHSPLTYADKVNAPLLIVQGATDPRVPKAESDQIVTKACEHGIDVEYLVFDDEGHGFTSRDNDIKAHAAVVEFLAKHLL